MRARVADIVNLPEAVMQRTKWKKAGRLVGITVGCFDLLHHGHTAFLLDAANACDRLIVIVSPDARARDDKGVGRPIMSLDERSHAICGVRGVDLVASFEGQTPERAIEELEPDFLFKGADYLGAYVYGTKETEACGGRVVILGDKTRASTSEIITRITSRYCSQRIT